MRLRREEMCVESARQEDLHELEELYSEACGYFKFDKPLAMCSPTDLLHSRRLPFGGEPENFELLCIRVAGMLIGYAVVYRDFPAKTRVDLLTLYIGERARGGGFGTQTAQMLCRYFYESGYETMRVLVSLRSWAGLRFWSRLGFDRIVGLQAEGDISDGSFGGMLLELPLNAAAVSGMSR